MNARIRSNGHVRWMPITHFTASCPLNVRNFPFDIQTCFLKLGSWSYDTRKIVFHLQRAYSDQEQYVRDYTWTIEGDYLVNDVNNYTASEYRWQNMKLIFIFSRNDGVYVLNIIMTCMCLSAVTLFTFFIPPSSGERLSAQLSVVIAIAVYQMIAMEEL